MLQLFFNESAHTYDIYFNGFPVSGIYATSVYVDVSDGIEGCPKATFKAMVQIVNEKPK